MLEIFSKIDPSQILNYGISGLGFLLAVLAFYLLWTEQKKKTPDRNILFSIVTFMVFALVVLGWSVHSEVGRTQKDEEIRKLRDQLKQKNFDVWHVFGTVQSDKGLPIQHSDEVRFSSIPPMGELYTDNTTFKVDILVALGKDGKPEFPKVQIMREPLDKFEPVTISLDADQSTLGNSSKDYQVEPHEGNPQRLDIKKPIGFNRISSSYNGTGSAPTPVPLESPAVTVAPGNGH